VDDCNIRHIETVAMHSPRLLIRTGRCPLSSDLCAMNPDAKPLPFGWKAHYDTEYVVAIVVVLVVLER